MKPFSLEEYLKNPSKKVVTRNGKSARIICTDRVNFDIPVMALVMEKSGIENSYSYRTDGQLFQNAISDQDLFFATEKHEKWVNVYLKSNGDLDFGNTYSSEKEAKDGISSHATYITTVKIEWEE